MSPNFLERVSEIISNTFLIMYIQASLNETCQFVKQLQRFQLDRVAILDEIKNISSTVFQSTGAILDAYEGLNYKVLK